MHLLRFIRFLFDSIRLPGYLLLAALPLLAHAQQPAGTTGLVVPYSTLPSGSGFRGINTTVPYQRAAMLLTRREIRGILPGTTFVSLGLDAAFSWPGQLPTPGTLRVWLRNSTDNRYHLHDTWNLLLTQQPNPFQQVYSGPVAITPTGPIDVRFQVPFTYTGGSLYVAYEWETTAPAMNPTAFELSVGAAYNPWWHSSTGTTGFPAQLRDSSLTRPRLRLGYPTPARDVAIVRAEGIGELPMQPSVLPYAAKALVRNQGSQPLVNLPVSLVPGLNAAGSTTTVLVPSLLPGAEVEVRLPGLVPQAAGGFTYYTIALPPDQNPANDVWHDSTVATSHDISYVRGFPFPVDVYLLFKQGVGNGRVGGTMLTRFPLRSPAQVSSVRLFLSHDRNSIDETVYGVVLDEHGRLLARSPDHLITRADQDNWLLCPLPSPAQVAGRAFFVGMVQRPHLRGLGGYYPPSHDPLAYQLEEFPRDSTCYITVGDSAIQGLQPPHHVPQTMVRLLIEAHLAATPLAVRPAAAPWVEAWPNPAPAHGEIQLTLPAATGPVYATLLDATGRVVRPEALLGVTAATATLPLRDLPPGLYVLHLRAESGQLSKRIVVN